MISSVVHRFLSAGSAETKRNSLCRALTGLFLLLSSFSLSFLSITASGDSSNDTYKLVSDLVYTYKTEQNNAYDEISALLAELKSAKPELGSAWERIMNYWLYVNEDLTVNAGALPDGLPEDGSLCIIILGYMLNNDGTMQEELLGRLQTGLHCAEQYPEAYVLVTGGGTALHKPEATEAGCMATWLTEHGIAPERIIIEDKSLTTGENALYSARIITERYPEVRHVAIVSSDYHVPLGCLLFQEQFLLTECAANKLQPSVLSNAAFPTETPKGNRLSEQAAYVWKLSEYADLY